MCRFLDLGGFPIRGRLRVELIRDLADGDLSHEQLGEKYGRCTQAINNFSAKLQGRDHGGEA